MRLIVKLAGSTLVSLIPLTAAAEAVCPSQFPDNATLATLLQNAANGTGVSAALGPNTTVHRQRTSHARRRLTGLRGVVRAPRPGDHGPPPPELIGLARSAASA